MRFRRRKPDEPLEDWLDALNEIAYEHWIKREGRERAESMAARARIREKLLDVQHSRLKPTLIIITTRRK